MSRRSPRCATTPPSSAPSSRPTPTWDPRPHRPGGVLMAGYAAVLAVAALATYGATFGVRTAAIRFGWVVMPDARKVHDKPMPTCGGAAMYVAFLVAMAVATQIHQ